MPEEVICRLHTCFVHDWKIPKQIGPLQNPSRANHCVQLHLKETKTKFRSSICTLLWEQIMITEFDEKLILSTDIHIWNLSVKTQYFIYRVTVYNSVVTTIVKTEKANFLSFKGKTHKHNKIIADICSIRLPKREIMTIYIFIVKTGTLPKEWVTDY